MAPLAVQRVASTSNGHAVAAEQLRALDQQSPHPKAVVADSGYANHQFLRLFLAVTTLCALVRLRNNQVLYEAGSVRQRRGRNRVHGDPFRLAAPARPPDRRAELALPGGTVVLKAWHDLHLQRLAALPGTVIQVRMLRPDGSRATCDRGGCFGPAPPASAWWICLGCTLGALPSSIPSAF